jgi:hypothetical protein
MPFLYNLLFQVLVKSTLQELSDTLGHTLLTTSQVNEENAKGFQLEGISYEMIHQDQFTGSHQCDLVSRWGLWLLGQVILIFIMLKPDCKYGMRHDCIRKEPTTQWNPTAKCSLACCVWCDGPFQSIIDAQRLGL